MLCRSGALLSGFAVRASGLVVPRHATRRETDQNEVCTCLKWCMHLKLSIPGNDGLLAITAARAQTSAHRHD